VAYYLVDTDAVIDYLKGIRDSAEMIKGIHDNGDVLCVCGVVVAEVFAGIHPVDRQTVFNLVSTFHFLTVSIAAARLAGEWRYQHARSGRILSTADMLVAATAHTHGASLVTGNVDHYPIAGLSVVPLPRARRP
jgi:predicted nucleic acid-binding protein